MNKLSENDQELVKVLRIRPMTVSELQAELGVTSNAVRQRLVRLMTAGLITRCKCEDESRGRPCHEYSLTEDGHRTAGNNFADLAKALWREIKAIEDAEIRTRLIEGTTERLIQKAISEIGSGDIDQKISSVRKFYESRQIPISFEITSSGPLLKILKCPYPDLAEHHFCEAERKIFSQVIGGNVELCHCGSCNHPHHRGSETPVEAEAEISP
ncbi:MAG: ArsR family transcriptional regulator [Planctomycetota bacterium]